MNQKIDKCCGVTPIGRRIEAYSDEPTSFFLQCPVCGLRSGEYSSKGQAINDWSCKRKKPSVYNWANNYEVEE